MGGSCNHSELVVWWPSKELQGCYNITSALITKKLFEMVNFQPWQVKTSLLTGSFGTNKGNWGVIFPVDS